MNVKNFIVAYVGQIFLLWAIHAASTDSVMKENPYLQYIWLSIAMAIIAFTIVYVITYKPKPKAVKKEEKKLQNVISEDDFIRNTAILLEKGHKNYNILQDQIDNSRDTNKTWLSTAKFYIGELKINYKKAEI